MKNVSILLVLLSVAGLAHAAPPRIWDGDNSNGLWIDPINWSGDTTPSLSNNVDVVYAASGEPTIRNGDIGNGSQIRVGASGGDVATLNIEAGGILNVGRWLIVGWNAIGYEGTVTTSGTINLGQTNPNNGRLLVGADSPGTLNMTGGIINVPGVFGISEVAGVSGTVNLYDGTIYAARFRMNNAGGSAGKLNIGGTGKLIVEGDAGSLIATYIANGWITTTSGGTIQYDYGITNPGQTTFWVLEPSTICLLGFGVLGLIKIRHRQARGTKIPSRVRRVRV
jgi:hypothetical protein